MLIGPAPARESYLNIAAHHRSGAAQRAPMPYIRAMDSSRRIRHFAEACAKAGIVFVGPPSSAMRAMGSKSAAKTLMEKSGVPLLPGYHGDRQDPAFLADQANRIGFPLMIKAVSGGGGRGMRVVSARPTSSPPHWMPARQEAASAFGDDRVLLERYLDAPAPHRGAGVRRPTRQRDPPVRARLLGAAAASEGDRGGTRAGARRQAARRDGARCRVAAATAVGYEGAGTVEFVANADGFYFLEMNTRLQVEHPVTEMITGLDLVEWQLRVAAGETLPVGQDAIRINGHAIEARIYAEDPERDFAPSIGRLALFRTPEPSTDVRIDTGFATGDIVSVHYDAMLAKLICHGATRDAALRTLQPRAGRNRRGRRCQQSRSAGAHRRASGRSALAASIPGSSHTIATSCSRRSTSRRWKCWLPLRSAVLSDEAEATSKQLAATGKIPTRLGTRVTSGG